MWSNTDVSFTLLCLVGTLFGGYVPGSKVTTECWHERELRAPCDGLRSDPIASRTLTTARTDRDRGAFLAPSALHHQRWNPSPNARRRSPLSAGSRLVLVVLVVTRFRCTGLLRFAARVMVRSVKQELLQGSGGAIGRVAWTGLDARLPESRRLGRQTWRKLKSISFRKSKHLL